MEIYFKLPATEGEYKKLLFEKKNVSLFVNTLMNEPIYIYNCSDCIQYKNILYIDGNYKNIKKERKQKIMGKLINLDKYYCQNNKELKEFFKETSLILTTEELESLEAWAFYFIDKFSRLKVDGGTVEQVLDTISMCVSMKEMEEYLKEDINNKAMRDNFVIVQLFNILIDWTTDVEKIDVYITFMYSYLKIYEIMKGE